jgi:putative hydrolase of the HAD superfamily
MSWPVYAGYDSHVALIRRRLRPMRPLRAPAAARLASLAGIRALVVDVYGTLLVSSAGEPSFDVRAPELRHLGQALRRAGHRGVSSGLARGALLEWQEEVRRRHAAARRRGTAFPELDARLAWRRVLDRLGLVPASLRASLLRFIVEYELASRPVWPMPGARSALAALHARGLRLGVASNAQFYTPPMLDAAFGLDRGRPLLEPSLCAWSWTHGKAKPSPDLLRHVLRALRTHHGIAPAETAIIGNDKLNDLLPAWRLGCRTILFAGDARSFRPRDDDPRCRLFTPDAVVRRWTDVPRLVAARA